MAFINFTFKKDGHVYDNAEARIVNEDYPNDETKIQTFKLAISPAGDKENVITKLGPFWVRCEKYDDRTKKSYLRIAELLESAKTGVAYMDAEIAAEVDEEKKMKLEVARSSAMRNDILQLDGATTDEQQ